MQASNLALPLTQPQAANTTVSKRLPSPHLLKQQMPLSSELAQQVQAHRQAIRNILEGRDERLLSSSAHARSTTHARPWNTPTAWPRSAAKWMTSCCW